MIPFNRASLDGNELSYLADAVEQGPISGNGPFAKMVEAMLANMHRDSTCLLTTSCTHSLEMAARLLDLQPGDEIVVPSYTFVSTASAFLWNGARPVFADVRADTLNIDPSSVEARITSKTRAICIVHYAGVGAEPDRFAEIARRHKIALIEDNAHGLGATYQGQPLGTFGTMSTLSFHETKNVTCGEGGALVINDPSLVERAEILRDKGTDRTRFMRGQVDKYTWVDSGSSWVLSEILAAVLLGQLERFELIQSKRRVIWDRYERALEEWAVSNGIHMPTVPAQAKHSAHMFYLRLPSLEARDQFIEHMRQNGALTLFHYSSLHASPQGLALGGKRSACPVSDLASETLVRLPLFPTLAESDQAHIITSAKSFHVR